MTNGEVLSFCDRSLSSMCYEMYVNILFDLTPQKNYSCKLYFGVFITVKIESQGWT